MHLYTLHGNNFKTVPLQLICRVLCLSIPNLQASIAAAIFRADEAEGEQMPLYRFHNESKDIGER